MVDVPLCLHCEKAAAASRLGLCPACHAVRGIRRLYRRRRGWTPQWEMHLRRLTHPVPAVPTSRPEAPPEPPARERRQRRAAEEVAGQARCPRCRVPLVARMGPAGPCFPCRCRGWRRPAGRKPSANGFSA